MTNQTKATTKTTKKNKKKIGRKSKRATTTSSRNPSTLEHLPPLENEARTKQHVQQHHHKNSMDKNNNKRNYQEKTKGFMGRIVSKRPPRQRRQRCSGFQQPPSQSAALFYFDSSTHQEWKQHASLLQPHSVEASRSGNNKNKNINHSPQQPTKNEDDNSTKPLSKLRRVIGKRKQNRQRRHRKIATKQAIPKKKNSKNNNNNSKVKRTMVSKAESSKGEVRPPEPVTRGTGTDGQHFNSDSPVGSQSGSLHVIHNDSDPVKDNHFLPVGGGGEEKIQNHTMCRGAKRRKPRNRSLCCCRRRHQLVLLRRMMPQDSRSTMGTSSFLDDDEHDKNNNNVEGNNGRRQNCFDDDDDDENCHFQRLHHFYKHPKNHHSNDLLYHWSDNKKCPENNETPEIEVCSTKQSDLGPSRDNDGDRCIQQKKNQDPDCDEASWNSDIYNDYSSWDTNSNGHYFDTLDDDRDEEEEEECNHDTISEHSRIIDGQIPRNYEPENRHCSVTRSNDEFHFPPSTIKHGDSSSTTVPPHRRLVEIDLFQVERDELMHWLQQKKDARRRRYTAHTLDG